MFILAWYDHDRHANRTCRISMNVYIAKVLLNYGHPIPKKPQLLPHKHREWRPIKFVLLVDDFGIEYVGNEHALHLLNTLEQNYEITTDWEGTKFSGIDLAWDYNARHANWICHIYMDGYISKVCLRYGHPSPKKPQLLPHISCNRRSSDLLFHEISIPENFVPSQSVVIS